MSDVRVYSDHKGTHVMYIQPGMHVKHVSDWISSEGVPLMFEVKFVQGVAEVTSSIAEYLIDKGLARATRIAVQNYNFARDAQKKSEDTSTSGEVIQCPDCSQEQPAPSEETHYICANYTCRRDFIKDPIPANISAQLPENHLANLLSH